jgi:hypothetical protein
MTEVNDSKVHLTPSLRHLHWGFSVTEFGNILLAQWFEVLMAVVMGGGGSMELCPRKQNYQALYLCLNISTSLWRYIKMWTLQTILKLRKIWGSHGSDYEECRLLGYKNPVRTSQETHYVSATESSRLILCKIWGFHGGHYEEWRLLRCYAVWLL